MSVGTTAATATSEDGDTAGAHELGGAAPYCAACGAWVGIFAPGEGWRHSRRHTALNGTRSPFDPGHEVDLAWCLPPARSVSPAQLEQLLAALDDAIAYREYASSSGYATAYRVLRRQLAGPLRPERDSPPSLRGRAVLIALSRDDIGGADRAWHAAMRGRPVLPRVVLPALRPSPVSSGPAGYGSRCRPDGIVVIQMPWWEATLFFTAVILAIWGFASWVGVQKRYLTRGHNRTAQDLYGEFADSQRKQRRYAKHHGGEWRNE